MATKGEDKKDENQFVKLNMIVPPTSLAQNVVSKELYHSIIENFKMFLSLQFHLKCSKNMKKFR